MASASSSTTRQPGRFGMVFALLTLLILVEVLTVRALAEAAARATAWVHERLSYVPPGGGSAPRRGAAVRFGWPANL